MPWSGIVGDSLTVEEFAEYVEGFQFKDWKPSFIVIHNTASPTLAQRPNGFTKQHLLNLESYYRDKQKWSSGPHLFIDDEKIHIFTPLDKKGTHSPSWNGIAWGVELLGDYDSDDPMTGRGAKVVANAASAVATLLKKLGYAPSSATIRLHKEDVKTTHACPGKYIAKSWFIAQVEKVFAPATPPGWSVVGPDGETVLDGLETGAKGTAIVRASVEAIGGSLSVDSENRVIRLVKAA